VFYESDYGKKHSVCKGYPNLVPSVVLPVAYHRDYRDPETSDISNLYDIK